MSSVGAGLIKSIAASSVLAGSNGLGNISNAEPGQTSTTKYRMNKINGNTATHHTISMSPGGAGGISGLTDSKIAISKNLRGIGATAGANETLQNVMNNIGGTSANNTINKNEIIKASNGGAT
jgi:hypothetical protein